MSIKSSVSFTPMNFASHLKHCHTKSFPFLPWYCMGKLHAVQIISFTSYVGLSFIYFNHVTVCRCFLFRMALPANEIARFTAKAITAIYRDPNVVLKSELDNGPKLFTDSTM